MFVLVVLASAIAGCSRKGTEGASSPSPVEGDTAASAVQARAYAEPHWTANLQPTQQRSGQVRPTSQLRAYGSVQMKRGSSEGRTLISITFTSPVSNTSYSWSLHSGRCGSGEMAVMPANSFPTLHIGSGGRGQASADIILAFPHSGNFHVNVFSGTGNNLTEVVSCGNLRYVGS